MRQLLSVVPRLSGLEQQRGMIVSNFHLSVKRWRDKVNGNSYFAARVYRDGELITVCPFQYGYGSAPDNTALVDLRNAGKIEAGRGCYLTAWCEDNGHTITVDDYTAKQREVKQHGSKDK